MIRGGLLVLIFCAALPQGALRAHGDLHQQIRELDRKLAEGPASAGLYAQRGDLHRFHGQKESAEKDYAAALRLDPNCDGANIGLAALYLQWGKAAAGLEPVGRFLKANPGNELGLGTKGRLLAALGRHDEAALAFGRALERESNVEYCLERAQSLEKAGRPMEAVAALDQAMASMGDLAVLEEEALAIERRHGKLELALQRHSRMLERPGRRESRLLVQGDLLFELGRKEEAREAWASALKEIAQLPGRLRDVRAVGELAARLRAKLDTR